MENLVEIIRFLSPGIWLDEAFTILLAKKSISEITYLTVQDFNPPLYYYFLHYWMKLFGDSLISLRTPSIIAYALFIYLMHHGIQRLGIKGLSVWLYTLLVATTPSVLYFSTEIRMYMLQATLVLFSIYLVIKKSWYLIPINIILLYLHSSSLFYVVSLYPYILSILKTDKRAGLRLLIYNSISLLFYTPWIYWFIKTHSIPQIQNPWIYATPNFLNLIRLPWELYSGISYLPTWVTPSPLIVLTGFFLIPMMIYLKKDYLSIKENTAENFSGSLQLIFISSIVTVAITSLYTQGFYWRYLWFIIGPFLLILCLYLNRISRKTTVSYIALSIFIQLNFIYFLIFGTWTKIKIPEHKRLLQPNQIVVTFEENILPLKYYFGENLVKAHGDYDEVPIYYGKAILQESDFVQAGNKVYLGIKKIYINQIYRIIESSSPVVSEEYTTNK